MDIRVLIADDSKFMRHHLRNMLNEAGVNDVLEAMDGEDLIEKYKCCKPDLVFTDILMPKKRGIEAILELRKLDADVKLVVCSSVAENKFHKDKIIDSDILGFIKKPYTVEDINDVLKKYKEKYYI